jgi:predicted tellurium resistance membrane protein TerC
MIMEHVIALLALTAMEIVLGIDNIVFIAILSDRLPAEVRNKARRIGLSIALVLRIALLSMLSWVMGLQDAVFQWTDLGIPVSWFDQTHEGWKEIVGVSWRDIIMLGGGLFLIAKTVHEIHGQTEGPGEEEAGSGGISFRSALVQIALLDIVFSLDSVITAIGMAQHIWVMIVAVIISVGVMMIFADRVSTFISANPSLKMLALSFLMLIGVMLVAEGIGTHVEKGYIYFAMGFSLIVEFLNLRVRSQQNLKKSNPAPNANAANANDATQSSDQQS